MKKLLLLFTLMIINTVAIGQVTSPGDLAFTAMNADGNDDFALATFKDITANSSIYFSDKEWTGTSFNTGENSWEWQTGPAVIPAGTVIFFNNISDATRSVTLGSYVGVPGGISATSDAIFAYLGTDVDTPISFLAAIANDPGAYGNLSGTGLTENLNAITYPSSTDIGAYNGPRTGSGIGGYLAALNDPTNYDFQAGSGDQDLDGTAPDLPFDTTIFSISNIDVTPPFVTGVTVIDATTLSIGVSEDVIMSTAMDFTNYSIATGVPISSLSYNASNLSISITHSGFTIGTAYQLTVSGLEDTSANVQNPSFISGDLYFNNVTSGLIISEIMYNAPGSVDDDDLEFVEIYNNSASTIPLGGLKFTEEGGTTFVLPVQDLVAGNTVLIATNKTFADAFYGVSFLDMGLPQTNVFGNGGELLSILNSQDVIIFSADYDDSAAWPLADGAGPSLELLDPSGNSNDGGNWTEASNLVGPSEMIDVFASPGMFTPVVATMPSISFDMLNSNSDENAGAATISISIDAAPLSGNVTATLTLINGSTAIENTDFSITNNTVTFSSTDPLTKIITVNLLDNANITADVFAAFELSNISGASIGNLDTHVLYIIDDETHAAAGGNSINMSFLTSYAVTGANPGAEIVAHDPASQRLFVMKNEAGEIEILDFANPNNITSITSIYLSSQTIGAQTGDVIQGTSVAVYNGIAAAASYRVEDASGNQLFTPGTVSFYEAATGNFLSAVTVGNLPDMLVFTPDGNKLLVANEGQPSDDYLTDPEGTISVIDVSAGVVGLTQTNVTEINFNSFDTQITSLRNAGLRVFGPNASVSEDVEPEYITVSSDSQTAFVALQENNAMAKIDLNTNTITNIFPFGLKDYNLPGNELDLNNELDFIFMANWPIKGMYMPDGIANYSIGGVNYVVTANEGDARDYGGYSEEIRVGDTGYVLDPVVFPNAALLKADGNLNRINATTATGDLDGDNDFDEIHVYGGRSFSIFNGNTGNLVYDSGDDFERIIKADPDYSQIFNTSNSNNTFKNRSDDKGPEPEGVIIQEINGVFYAFIGLERVGGLMVYNISNPAAPIFEAYVNNRGFVPGANESGDLGPEGLIYIKPTDNSTATGLVVLANEVSATLSIYQVAIDTAGITDVNANDLVLFPNPVNVGEYIFFNKPSDYILFDMNGRKITTKQNATHIRTEGLDSGIYLVQLGKQTFKIIIN
jgi:hypothetical protein